MRFTYKDILDQLEEEFPEVDRFRIEKIVRYGLSHLRTLLRLDLIVKLHTLFGTVVIFNPDSKNYVPKIAWKKVYRLIKYRERHKNAIERYYDKHYAEKIG